jgi:6-bladed beta-propeller
VPTTYWNRAKALAVVTLASLFPIDLPAQEFSVRDSLGITIVDNAKAEWAPGQEWRLSDRPVLRIGGPLDGGDLWQVRGLLRMPDGSYAVLSAGHSQVKIFDARGSFLRSLGRAGQGPGEFSFPMGIALAPPDTILVMDRDAIEVFLAYGTVLGSEIALPVPNAFGPGKSAVPIMVGRDRSMIARVEWPFSTAGVSGPVRPPMGLGFFRRPGQPPSFVGLYEGALQEFVDIGQADRQTVMSPFARFTVAGVGPSETAKFFVADNARYEIRLFDSDAMLRRIIRREYTPTAVRTEWVEDWEEAQRASPTMGGQLPRLERGWREMTVPETLPAFDAVTFDTDGYLWVTRSAGVPGGSPSYDIFDPDGRFLGEVEGPSGVRSTLPPLIDRDRVMVLSVGGLGVERVAVYALTRGH